MDEISPWDEWVGVILPFYYKGQRGRPPKGVEVMLRMYLLQCWFHLSDEGVEDAIYDSYAFRRFMGINFLEQDVPDATTLLHFRHLLEENGLNKVSFEAINRVMVASGHMMKGGTIVDATIIDAPNSTKNAEKKRDPEMHQTKKGGQWRFGMIMPYRRRRGKRTGSHHRGHRGKNPLCAARWSMRSASSNGSSGSRRFHIEDLKRTRTGFTLCSPMPIFMCWLLPGEVPARHHKGAVCPF